VLDNAVFTTTETGTGQGSILSPLLANVALHGVEDHIRSYFPARAYFGSPGGRYAVNWKPQLIKYADDFLILHRDKAVIHRCQQLVAEWLRKLGLELHPTKTRTAHTLAPQGGKAGFDFLGFEIRQYPVSRHNAAGGFKTLIKPSRDAIKRHYAHLCEIIRNNRAARQDNLIGQLNPVITGWSKYYRAVVSKAVFQRLDNGSAIHVRLSQDSCYSRPEP
jgi:RNA-directed DNA polymerase